AIAAEAGSPLADAIGLYKEVDDSRGGSGFSFNDIAADRAGTRFGVLAVQQPRKLQAMLAAGAKERDFMPDVSDLPEFMQEAEFKRRYGGIGAPAYNKVMADIEARIASRSFFRYRSFGLTLAPVPADNRSSRQQRSERQEPEMLKRHYITPEGTYKVGGNRKVIYTPVIAVETGSHVQIYLAGRTSRTLSGD